MVDLIFQIILCVIIMLFPLYMIWEMIKGLFKTPKMVKPLIEEQEIKRYSIESIAVENEYERN